MKSRKELLKSPHRHWNDVDKEYDSVLIVPSGEKHESGYMMIAVIGVTLGKGVNETYEIAAMPDDLQLQTPPERYKGAGPHVRMDCYYPQGILHYHGRGKFRVSAALSSVTITFTPSND